MQFNLPARSVYKTDCGHALCKEGPLLTFSFPLILKEDESTHYMFFFVWEKLVEFAKYVKTQPSL